jgi:hypothetical protein
MAAIGRLEGINSDEVAKFCRAGITTVEKFADFFSPHFIYGAAYLSVKTGIKPDRLIQLLPPENLQAELVPDEWLEAIVTRVLRKARPDDPWLKRCRLRLRGFVAGLRGIWLGWRPNLPLAALLLPLILMLGLSLRAAGKLQWLPPPLGLRDQVLIVGRGIPSGKTLERADIYQVYLPLSDDYFQSHQTIEALVAAKSLSSNLPLRFSDTLRQQVVAAKDLDAGMTIQSEDVKFVWTVFQPDAVVSLAEAYGCQLHQPVRKDGPILRRFLKPQ